MRGKGRRSQKRTMFQPGFPSARALGLVDMFLFLADARIPWTCRTLSQPYLRRKNRVYVLAKPDLADPEATSQWVSVFKNLGEPVFAVDCSTGNGLAPLVTHLKNAQSRLSRPLRVMLFGTPNVGKSSLANRLLKSRKAPFGAKPGLTRGSNWLKAGPDGFLVILDTPGVLDTSQVKGEAKHKLAAVWATGERTYDTEEVAVWLAAKLNPLKEPVDFINSFAKERGMLGKGGIVDYEKACAAVVHGFREGRLGRFTLERPQDFSELKER